MGKMSWTSSIHQLEYATVTFSSVFYGLLNVRVLCSGEKASYLECMSLTTRMAFPSFYEIRGRQDVVKSSM